MSSGKSEQAKGRVKEAVGSLTGNDDLKAEGRADQRSGETKRAVENVSEQVKSTVEDLAGKATVAVDKSKDALHQR